jgi:hypothetical protein
LGESPAKNPQTAGKDAAALKGVSKREIGAVERNRTSTSKLTATSTLRVYHFRHDRIA